MPDALGGETGPPALESLDYLGTKVPTSFKSQPALPTGRPAAASGSAPSTIGGGGVAGKRHIMTRPEATNLFDMLQGVFQEQGGGPGVDSGGPGAGVSPSPPGSIVGYDPQSIQAAVNFVTSPALPGKSVPGLGSIGDIASFFGGKTPSLGVVGPTGQVQGAFPGERSGTGIKAVDAVLGFLGIPTGLLSGVFTSPELTQEFAQTIMEARENLGLPMELVEQLAFVASGKGAFALGAPGAGIAAGTAPGQPGSPGFGSPPFSWGPAQTPPGYPGPKQGLGVDPAPAPAPPADEGFPGESLGEPSSGPGTPGPGPGPSGGGGSTGDSGVGDE